MKRYFYRICFAGILTVGSFAGGWKANDLYQSYNAVQKVNGFFSMNDDINNRNACLNNSKKEVTNVLEGRRVLSKDLEFKSFDIRGADYDEDTKKGWALFSKEGRFYGLEISMDPMDTYFRFRDATDDDLPR